MRDRCARNYFEAHFFLTDINVKQQFLCIYIYIFSYYYVIFNFLLHSYGFVYKHISNGIAFFLLARSGDGKASTRRCGFLFVKRRQ